MKNFINITGTLPNSNRIKYNYKAAHKDNDGKDVPSWLAWQVDILMGTKDSQTGYWDKMLVDFTCIGYYAEMIKQHVIDLPEDSPERKNVQVNLSGKLIPGYWGEDENGKKVTKHKVKIVASDVEFVVRKSVEDDENKEDVQERTSRTPSKGSGAGSKPTRKFAPKRKAGSGI